MDYKWTSKSCKGYLNSSSTSQCSDCLQAKRSITISKHPELFETNNNSCKNNQTYYIIF